MEIFNLHGEEWNASDEHEGFALLADQRFAAG